MALKRTSGLPVTGVTGCGAVPAIQFAHSSLGVQLCGLHRAVQKPKGQMTRMDIDSHHFFTCTLKAENSRCVHSLGTKPQFLVFGRCANFLQNFPNSSKGPPSQTRTKGGHLFKNEGNSCLARPSPRLRRLKRRCSFRHHLRHRRLHAGTGRHGLRLCFGRSFHRRLGKRTG